MTAAYVLLLVLVALGCSATGGSATSSTVTASTVTASTVTASTTAPTVTASTARPGGSSSADSTVRTDGGTVVVRARDGALELVDVRPTDGWTGDHVVEDATHLVVAFRRKGARVDVTVDLTPSGISTSTRSVATG